MNVFRVTCLAILLALGAEVRAQVPDSLSTPKQPSDNGREIVPRPAMPGEPDQPAQETSPVPLPDSRRDPERTLSHPPPQQRRDATGSSVPEDTSRPSAGSDPAQKPRH